MGLPTLLLRAHHHRTTHDQYVTCENAGNITLVLHLFYLWKGRLDIKTLMPTFYVDSKNDLPREIMGFRIIQKINSLANAPELIFCIILNPIISLGR